MKVLTVIGARPQFIKAAPLCKAFARAGIENKIIHTGQHFDENMSKIFFDDMEIPQPDYNLDIHSLSHGAMSGRMMEKIEEIILREHPDVVLVFGDTNSTLAGAISAKKQHFPIAHVEAGLRSFNMEMPEEVNRILTDRVSDVLFCPTEAAIENLKKEGFDHFETEIIHSGDVMYDALKMFTPKAEEKSTIIRDLNLQNEKFFVATIHREENTASKESLDSIFKALETISEDCAIVLPVHPRTRSAAEAFGFGKGVRIINPVGYLDMLQLLKNCRGVITDSGGLQKEAYFAGKYCITVRFQTEWVELVDEGKNILVGNDYQKIVEAYKFIRDKETFSPSPLYGLGDASEIIVEVLKNKYKQ